MLRSMLVGLDGSPHSAAAVDLGIAWARRFDALLVGLGIFDEPTIRRPQPVPLGAGDFKLHRDDALLLDARHRVEQFLGQFALRCAESDISCKLLEKAGLPAEHIQTEAQRYDLILLGQQTYFHFEVQDTACDTLELVLRSSPRPVVAVPEPAAYGSTVMIAYDGSPQAARALQVFQALGLAGDDEVHVVCIDHDRIEAARRADRAVEFLRLHKTAAHALPLASTSPVSQILLEQAHRLNARLLVMGAFGHSTLRELFVGSVTRTVLRESSVPLLLYH